MLVLAAVAFNPNKYGDKLERVRLISALIESGIIWLPTNSPKCDRLLMFADEFLEEVIRFPNSSSRDLVDTMTQSSA